MIYNKKDLILLCITTLILAKSNTHAKFNRLSNIMHTAHFQRIGRRTYEQISRPVAGGELDRNALSYATLRISWSGQVSLRMLCLKLNLKNRLRNFPNPNYGSLWLVYLKRRLVDHINELYQRYTLPKIVVGSSPASVCLSLISSYSDYHAYTKDIDFHHTSMYHSRLALQFGFAISAVASNTITFYNGPNFTGANYTSAWEIDQCMVKTTNVTPRLGKCFNLDKI